MLQYLQYGYPNANYVSELIPPCVHVTKYKNMTAIIKKDLIERYNLTKVEVTRYNEIFENDSFVLIANTTNGRIKIKPKTDYNDR